MLSLNLGKTQSAQYVKTEEVLQQASHSPELLQLPGRRGCDDKGMKVI